MLYNVTSLLASVGAGFDVAKIHETDTNEAMGAVKNVKRSFHNTYHGATRHIRAPLFSMIRPEEKPTRAHNESPQHYLPSTLSSTSGISTGPSSSYGTQLTTPSSFTKLSSTSFTEETYDNRGGSCFPEEYLNYCNHSIIEGKETKISSTEFFDGRLRFEPNLGFDPKDYSDVHYSRSQNSHISPHILSSTPKYMQKCNSLGMNAQQRRRGRTLSNISAIDTNQRYHHLQFNEYEMDIMRDTKKITIEPIIAHELDTNTLKNSNPAYVNVPLFCSSETTSITSESKDYFDQNMYPHFVVDLSSKQLNNTKRAQIASPESDIITPNAESSEESYLSAISSQSKVKLTSPDMTSYRFANNEFNISLPIRKHSIRKEFHPSQS